MPRFKPPTPEETQRALGPLESLPANLVRALTDVSAFSRLPKPRRGEWLAEFPEPGESLKQYERKWAKCTPHAYFTTLYIVPVGTFEPAPGAAAHARRGLLLLRGEGGAGRRARRRPPARAHRRRGQPQAADDIFAVMRRKPPRDALRRWR